MYQLPSKKLLQATLAGTAFFAAATGADDGRNNGDSVVNKIGASSQLTPRIIGGQSAAEGAWPALSALVRVSD